MTKPSRILLGITGGIAAYKTLELVRLLRKAGHEVQVVMTRHACKLLAPHSFTALTGRPVATKLFPNNKPVGSTLPAGSVQHIDLASWADLVLVAPATANILGKLAHGIADDLLSTLLLAIPSSTLQAGRVLLAPSMNSNMWLHPAVQDNLALLAKRGYVLIQPTKGELACGTSGPGRLPEPSHLFALCAAALSQKTPDLAGVRVLLTVGRTEEPLDPVRIITNRSSGKLGAAICRQLILSRAKVRLIAGVVSTPLPEVETERVRTTAEMLEAVLRHLPETDVLVMCAAPADYRPEKVGKKKLHTPNLQLELVRTPDILQTVSQTEHRALVVGFSLDPDLNRARQKLNAKKMDLIVVNDYATADSDSIQATLLSKQKRLRRFPLLNKNEFAALLLKEIAKLWQERKRQDA